MVIVAVEHWIIDQFYLFFLLIVRMLRSFFCHILLTNWWGIWSFNLTHKLIYYFLPKSKVWTNPKLFYSFRLFFLLFINEDRFLYFIMKFILEDKFLIFYLRSGTNRISLHFNILLNFLLMIFFFFFFINVHRG